MARDDGSLPVTTTRGDSCFLMDGLAPNIKEMESMPGVALTDLWETDRFAGQQ